MSNNEFESSKIIFSIFRKYMIKKEENTSLLIAKTALKTTNPNYHKAPVNLDSVIDQTKFIN